MSFFKGIFDSLAKEAVEDALREAPFLLSSTSESAKEQFRRGLTFAHDRNFVEAAKWHRLAAEKGHAEAQLFLGFQFWEGLGVKKDEVEATRWYRKAAEQGHAQGQYSVGVILADDDHCDAKQKAEAVQWFRKAAIQGHADAQCSLAYLYVTGSGVAKDEAEGARWYRKAAEQGHADSQYSLGLMLVHGLGVVRDLEQAYFWLLLGSSDNSLADEVLEELEEQLSEAQCSEIQMRASKWKPSH